jgi:hypothetical protein
MGIAPRAVLLVFQAIRMDLLVLLGGVITAFALGASHGYQSTHRFFSLSSLSNLQTKVDV